MITKVYLKNFRQFQELTCEFNEKKIFLLVVMVQENQLFCLRLI